MGREQEGRKTVLSIGGSTAIGRTTVGRKESRKIDENASKGCGRVEKNRGV